MSILEPSHTPPNRLQEARARAQTRAPLDLLSKAIGARGPCDLLDGNRLGQVARFIDIRSTNQRHVVGQQLQRHHVQQGGKLPVMPGQA